MPTTTPCDLHDLWPCAICNGDLARNQQADRQADVALTRSTIKLGGGWFLARFPGHCSGCGQNYGVESPIKSDDHGGWRAMGCCG